MSVKIIFGKVYDEDKAEFCSCPYNNHEYCRASCVMICYDKDTQGNLMIEMCCSKPSRREHVTEVSRGVDIP